MKYITLNELVQTIRHNIHKIPHDIDFIIGIPRSGMIAASIISEYINVPLIDYKSFCCGMKPSGGNRLTLTNRKPTGKVLVIDDTCYSGASMKGAMESLKRFTDYNFIFSCVYLEGPGEEAVDLWLEDVRMYTDNFKSIVLYEWNIQHHYPFISEHTMYDIDGVLCVDPCDERMEAVYVDYIRNATPLFIPTVKIGKIVTYRLIKYADITQNWLKKQDIRYKELLMFNAQSWEERNSSGISPEQMKGNLYKIDTDSILFIESDDRQAQAIHEISGKPVLSIEKNILYS